MGIGKKIEVKMGIGKKIEGHTVQCIRIGRNIGKMRI